MRYRLLLEGGEVRHLQARMMTHADEQGRPQRVIGTSQDVTGMVESQRLLRESEQKFRSLFELSPLGIALIGPEGHPLQFNRAFQQLIGFEPCSTEGLDLPRETLQALEGVRRTIQGGAIQNHHAQLDLVRTDGSKVPVEIIAQGLPTADADQVPQELIWLIAEDIRERRTSEQSLRQAANVFRYAQEGIMITEPDGRIVDVNETFSRMTGYSHQEIVGSNPRILRSGRHDHAFYAEMWEQLSIEGSWSGEVINRAKDGSLLEMLETISTVHDEHGNPTHYVALLTDIRQIKQQQKLLEKQAHYDQLTGLANRILLSIRLEQAMDEASNNDEVIAVCYLDLDGFKEVNDTLGHPAGDQLLKILASRMRRIMRGSDLLARIGGTNSSPYCGMPETAPASVRR
jgi:PAS domain S-box-containing protein